MSIRFGVTTLALTALLTACGGGDGASTAPPGPGPVVPPDTLSVASVSVTIGAPEVGPGVITYAEAVLRNANGNQLPRRTVLWSSSNPAVANVDAFGVIEALAPGTATISATSEQRTGGAVFSVLPIARVVVNAAADSVVRGHGLSLEGVGLDAQGQPIRRKAVWSAEPSGRVTFDITGDFTTNIIGLSDGPVTISVWVAGVKGSRTFTVIAPVLSQPTPRKASH